MSAEYELKHNNFAFLLGKKAKATLLFTFN